VELMGNFGSSDAHPMIELIYGLAGTLHDSQQGTTGPVKKACVMIPLAGGIVMPAGQPACASSCKEHMT
jgi:hypothetical protein